MGRPRKRIPVGTRFGRLQVLGPGPNRGRNSTSRCRCNCGVVKVIINGNLKNTESCGCKHREDSAARAKGNKYHFKHGLRKTLTYSSWLSMIQRCKDTNNEVYGAKGIFISPRYIDMDVGIVNLVADIGHRPSKAHSIDRIVAEDGYVPGNIRWVTRCQQNQNIGLKKSNTSGYKGVLKTRYGRWNAGIRANGVSVNLGYYATKEEAAYAYNIGSLKLHGEYGQRNKVTIENEEVRTRVKKKVRAILQEVR